MGCLFEMITLPFRAVYYLFKAIWEIGEFFDHRSRRRHKREANQRRTRSTTAHKIKASRHQHTDIPDELTSVVETYMKIARDNRRKLDTRLDAYRSALRRLDEIRKLITPSEISAANSIEKSILEEYRALMTENTETKGMLTIGPAMDIRNAADARREGIQGAQWSAASTACLLCKSLDGKTISVDHPDFDRFRPPLHDDCRCFFVYVGGGQTNFTPDWETPSDETLRQYAPNLLEHPI